MSFTGKKRQSRRNQSQPIQSERNQSQLTSHRVISSALQPELLEARRLMSGTWTTLANQAPGAVGTMELLSNGSVLTTTNGDGAGNNFAILTPNSTGSYVNGTWTQTANANDTRLFDATAVLPSGNVFYAGGEYGSGNAAGEVYNPQTNTWTKAPAQPFGGFGDCLSIVLANGSVLLSPVGPSTYGGTTIYNPTTNSWSQGPTLYNQYFTDEQGWVKLADGSILTVGPGSGSSTSERYIPASNRWIADAALPITETDSLGEYGAATLLPNGNAMFIGATGNSAIYTPSGTTAPGTWVAGPTIPGGLGEDDASAAMLRDGTFLVTASPANSYNGPTTLFLYTPSTNAFTAVAGPNSYSGPAFLTRMLALPNGDLLYSENGSTLYQYDPGTTALASSVPTITSVVRNTNGSLTLTGTNLNGINVGATYGDDAQMDTNYPLVRLTSGSNVYYARTTSWSNTGVMLGSTSETVNVTLPLGIPAGTYSLVAVANGVPSTPTSLTISTTANNIAPTIATAAAISSTTVTGQTATLSVLGADDAGESNLNYTWVNTSAPSGQQTASFATNGVNASKSDVVTFHEIGTYTFAVTVTDSGGLSVSSGNVSVTVTQTLTSVSVTPTPSEVSAGQSKRLSAAGYDQFGALMNAQPTFNWAVTSGGGTISPAGVYTAPATGTLATVTASTGSLNAAATISVVNVQWTATDIGTVAAPGTAYDSTTTTTLTNTSDDIWNASDDFQFDYQQLSGDMTITAKLVSQTSVSTYIKAGLMIRNTLDANSAMAMIADPSNGPLFEWRTAAAGTAAQTATSTGATAPYWLQLVRSGNVFNAYASPNGTTWTLIGTQTIAMNTNVYVGLALTSHDTNHSATAVFSNVSVVSNQTLTSVKVISTPVNLTTGQSQQLLAAGYDQNGMPMSSQPAFSWAVTSGSGSVTSAGVYTAPATGTLATVTATSATLSATATVAVVNSPWVSTDIGTVSITGTAYDSSTTTTLTNASDDIWNQSDDFHFDYQTMTGNGSITARLVSQTSASTYIKAGVMMRNSLAANDAMAMISDPSPGPDFEWRTTASATAGQIATTAANNPPYFLRLVRNGNLFSSYSSANGITWTLVGTQTIVMNNTIDVGLALTSHNTAALATAVFNSVVISTPSVATAAAANPNPVTGSTATLSTLGANTQSAGGEAGLTYSWASTSIPSGATTPTFSVNGTNAAKNTVATFSQAGSYTFVVTIADSVGNKVTSTVTVNVVSQTLTSITISPANPTIGENATQAFTATAYDQFGAVLATQPSFTWGISSGIGSINNSGVYTSPNVAGTATITATSGTVTGTTTIAVNNAPPTVTTPASATPSPVTGTTATLSVAGTADLGPSDLTYTWNAIVIPSGAALPTFSINGTNAASTTVVTFPKAGPYKFAVILTDSRGATASSTVSVTVNATLSVVSLSSSNIALGGSTQASAFDQFGNPLATAPAWTATGGTITTTGFFTAGNAGGTFSITATSGGVSKSANVTVLSNSFTGVAGADTYVVRVSPGNSSIEQLFVNSPETGTPTYTFPISQVPNLSFTTASDGALTIDFANGNPLPAGGINFTGGNLLSINGAASGGMAFTVNDSQIVYAPAASSPITYTTVSAIHFNLVGGSNALTQNVQPLAAMTYSAGPGNNALTVNGGSYTFSNDPQIDSGNLTINDNAQVILRPPDAGAGYFICHVATLNIAANASAAMAASPDVNDRTVLVTNGLSISPGGTLNLANNAIILHNGDVAAVTAMITTGYNVAAGYWNGPGIDSTFAAGDSTHLTQLGAILNSQGGVPFYTSFDTQPTLATDVLVKYTYAGDANLDGKVDGSDYSRIDSAALTGATGWFNGDFNYDGFVNGSDYTLMDNAFNIQGGTLPKKPAAPTTLIAVMRESKAEPSVANASASASLSAASGTRLDAAAIANPARDNLATSLFSNTPIAGQQSDILSVTGLAPGELSSARQFLDGR